MFKQQLQIMDVDVLDTVSGELISRATVEIDEGQIRAINRKGSSKPAEKRIDGAGRTLLPGLIDVHVHLCLDGTSKALENYLSEARSTTLDKIMDHLEKTLGAGVTTIRDAGGPMATMEKVKTLTDGASYPNLISCGPVITTPGGHGYYFGLEIANEEELLEALEIIDQRFDFFKIMGSGGSLTKGTDLTDLQFSERELKMIGHYAKSRNKLCSIHLHSSGSIGTALTCGMKSIEHGSFASLADIKAIRQKGAYYVPTLVPGEYTFNALAGQDISDKEERVLSREAAALMCFQQRANLATGTDGGVPYTPHGRVCDEVIYLNRLGLPPLVALQAATTKAANLLGWGNRIGSVRAGYQADLIMTNENPLENLATLKEPSLVIKEGRVVSSK